MKKPIERVDWVVVWVFVAAVVGGLLLFEDTRSALSNGLTKAAEAVAPVAGSLTCCLPVALFLAGFYFVPTIIAAKRNAINVAWIVVLNLLLGWTVLGWIAALVWACTDENS